jgi:hypothetical protein
VTTALLVYVATSAVSCSLTSVSQIELKAPQAEAPLDARQPAIEEAERDATFLAHLDPENRALELGRMWWERGIELERSSYAGAFSAFARSAQLTLEALLGERCRSPFHAPCLELDQSNKRALDGLTKLLMRNSWSPPELAATRYRLSPETVSTFAHLRSWQISLDQPSSELQRSRPGLGFTTVGCRHFRGSDTVCAPLTFVASFSPILPSQPTVISLMALDALRQDSVTIDSVQLPLAAAVEQTIDTLGSIAGNSAGPRLYCLSLPTPETGATVIIVETSEARATATNVVSPLIRDSTVRGATSFCLHTLGSTPTGARNVRALLESLRVAQSAPLPMRAGTSRLSPLRIIAIGERASHMGTALASRAARPRTSRTTKTSRGVQFAPKALIIIDSSQTAEQAAQSDYEISTVVLGAPCDVQCLTQLKRTLEDTETATEKEVERAPAILDATPSGEALEVSPVM